jgi:serine/threonine protein kinase/Tol biopolymer transport system component
MDLTSGTRLGPYEVLELLGTGGMGEVYRARDTRLDRVVAIKILPAQLSSDPARKQRFEREARIISKLNHPHICTLHDIGHQDGIDYLVMECVEGETLDKRLQRGPVPTEQVLKFGTQIADALDKAHRNGVIHRDLKPGNIMLTASGAKLLDFGLAKPVLPLADPGTLTLTEKSSPVTELGAIVGTFQYMSPEQIEGKDLDGRSDIFSLGAVLYETLTGKRPFEGKSRISEASAILEREPAPVSTTKPAVPAALDHAIQRCLAKNPEDRWQTVRDVKLELQWLAESGSKPTVSPSPLARKTQRAWIVPASLAVIAVAIAAVLAVHSLERASPELRVIRSMILPPEGGSFIVNGPVGGAFLSPDGGTIAFIARVGKEAQLWLRRLDSFTARPLAGTEDVSFAFWSPDGRNLGFFSQGKLKRIPVTGGPPQVLCDADSNRGGSWGRSDVIIFSRTSGEILRIPAAGGIPQRVTTLDASRHEGTHRWPHFLPDGNHFLFMAALLGPVNEGNDFYVGSLDGKPSKILGYGSSPTAYANGHVLYLAGTVLMARPFDLTMLEFTGEALPVAEGVQFDPMFSNGVFSASEKGTLLYQQGKGSNPHSLVLFDRTGKQLASLGESNPGSTPRFSPDDKSLAYDLIMTDTGRVDLWLVDIKSRTRLRLTSDPLTLVSHFTVWSPDGTRIAYTGMKSNSRAIFIKAIKQISQEQERWEAKDDVYVGPSQWTPDGKFLVLTERPIRTGELCVSLLTVATKDGPVPLIAVKGANVDSGQVSPDGRWIAYRSDESGRNEIYISSFPKPVGKLQVSVSGGVTPRWRSDGKELYYLAPDKKLMAVELKESNGSLQPLSVRPLWQMFHTMFLTAAGVNQYDVSKDGRQFAVDSVMTDESSAPLNLVTNWPMDLNKK